MGRSCIVESTRCFRFLGSPITINSSAELAREEAATSAKKTLFAEDVNAPVTCQTAHGPLLPTRRHRPGPRNRATRTGKVTWKVQQDDLVDRESSAASARPKQLGCGPLANQELSGTELSTQQRNASE
mmetsp:Transcript_51428/g.137256  ORF Transcript_51428/g.137256 Transcript_51428/m.137256 type:complete len:128 (-) Transcript_51428:3-386(-)